jgi:CRISPR-associated exonuclease Cas4
MAIAAPSVLEALNSLVREAEELGVHGLSFQHILLCPTRTWLHYHRLDCAHLNRHMQLGLLLHEHGLSNTLSQSLYGLSPDRIDWARREVSEIKKSRSHEAALMNQLLFYLAALTVATGHIWRGVLRYTASRRTQAVLLDPPAILQLQNSLARLREVLRQPRPPAQQDKPVCRGCSYRLLCWGKSTEDEDA